MFNSKLMLFNSRYTKAIYLLVCLFIHLFDGDFVAHSFTRVKMA